jgi:glycosyltransferase involved in cell wall biosynthesis
VNGTRILLTTDLIGGVWDFCLALAGSLDAQVTLLALGSASAAQRTAAREVGADLVCAPLKLEWMQDAQTDVSQTADLVRRMVRDVRPHVVHANQFAAALADVDVPVVLTLHSDVLSWRRWTLGAEGIPAEWHAYVRLVTDALRCADRVVAVSRFLAAETRDLYGCRGPIDVIHNGWPQPSETVARRSGTLLAGRVWDSAKNIPLAAQAAQGWDPGEVLLAGAQDHPESGTRLPVEAPLQQLGQLTRAELDRQLQRTAIYLSPARYDPFGLLPLQAALHGAALLLSDIPSYRELWDGAACFFRSGDRDDLRRQWRHLLEDHAARSGLARAAHARAASQYPVGGMARAYERVYATASRSLAA